MIARCESPLRVKDIDQITVAVEISSSSRLPADFQQTSSTTGEDEESVCSFEEWSCGGGRWDVGEGEMAGAGGRGLEYWTSNVVCCSKMPIAEVSDTFAGLHVYHQLH